MNEIKKYLRENNLIIVDQSENPFSFEEIESMILNETEPIFYVKYIVDLEKETIKDTIEYINNAEKRIHDIIEENNQVSIVQAFVKLMEALVSLEKIMSHFGSETLTSSWIQTISEKALSQIEKENYSYLVDLLEYEIMPKLVELKEALLQRNE
ncbi:hypothetical protein [Tepidibacillus marianensis]|uniref:hypothetical protein n=1 Tax=Tepidibacillus marianensis TaxID=3131995 RepID=UPI0030CC01BC